MTDDWAGLGKALKAARVLRGLEQGDIAKATGKTRGAIRNIENGAIKSISATVIAYARLVGWTEESVRLVLEGKDPVMRDSRPRAADVRAAENIASAPETPRDLSLRVMQALVEGPLIDSQVITVRTESGEVTATLVVRGEPDATPEELVEQYKAWRDRGPVLDRPDDRDEDGAGVT